MGMAIWYSTDTVIRFWCIRRACCLSCDQNNEMTSVPWLIYQWWNDGSISSIMIITAIHKLCITDNRTLKNLLTVQYHGSFNRPIIIYEDKISEVHATHNALWLGINSSVWIMCVYVVIYRQYILAFLHNHVLRCLLNLHLLYLKCKHCSFVKYYQG